jgi:hypothetical protein
MAKKICLYTVLHMFTQLLFWAGNQGNNRPILASQETLTDFHVDEAKKNIFFEKEKSKMSDSKKTEFFSQIGPWVSRIDLC